MLYEPRTQRSMVSPDSDVGQPPWVECAPNDGWLLRHRWFVGGSPQITIIMAGYESQLRGKVKERISCNLLMLVLCLCLSDIMFYFVKECFRYLVHKIIYKNFPLLHLSQSHKTLVNSHIDIHHYLKMDSDIELQRMKVTIGLLTPSNPAIVPRSQRNLISPSCDSKMGKVQLHFAVVKTISNSIPPWRSPSSLCRNIIHNATLMQCPSQVKVWHWNLK